VIIETLTDNKNRTVADVRSGFSKYGGNLGETGSVSFMFNKLGMIQYAADGSSADDIFEAAIESGANDVESEDKAHLIYTEVDAFNSCLDVVTEKLGQPDKSSIVWKPQDYVVIDDVEKAQKILKLIDVLEESDDVQNVFGNYEFSESVYKQIEG